MRDARIAEQATGRSVFNKLPFKETPLIAHEISLFFCAFVPFHLGFLFPFCFLSFFLNQKRAHSVAPAKESFQHSSLSDILIIKQIMATHAKLKSRSASASPRVTAKS
jgi:hypothetical protein